MLIYVYHQRLIPGFARKSALITTTVASRALPDKSPSPWKCLPHANPFAVMGRTPHVPSCPPGPVKNPLSTPWTVQIQRCAVPWSNPTTTALLLSPFVLSCFPSRLQQNSLCVGILSVRALCLGALKDLLLSRLGRATAAPLHLLDGWRKRTRTCLASSRPGHSRSRA